MKSAKIKTVLKFNKSSIPALIYGVQTSDSELTFSNLQTTVKINSSVFSEGMCVLPDKNGLYYADRTIELRDFDLPPMDLGEKIIEFDMTIEIMKELQLLRGYCSDDELRPIMTGVNLNHNHFAATDAHILRYSKHGLGFKKNGWDGEITIHREVLDLLDIEVTKMIIYYNYTIIETKVDGFDAVVYSRNVEGKYPNYMVVIPETHGYNRVVEFTRKDIQQFILLQKREAVEGRLGTFILSDIRGQIDHQDSHHIDTRPLYSNEQKGMVVDTILMPVMITGDMSGWEDYEDLIGAVNINLIDKMSKKATGVKLFINDEAKKACYVQLTFAKPKTVSKVVKNDELNRLRRFRDMTVGLWATDKPNLIDDPKKLLFEIKF